MIKQLRNGLIGLLAILSVAATNIKCNEWECDYSGNPAHSSPACIKGRSVTAEIVDNYPIPVVDAKIDGVDAKLVLDTGAVTTVISSSFLGRHGRTTASINEICIKGDGEMCFGLNWVAAWDTYFTNNVPRNEDYNGRPSLGINGILGMGVLHNLIFELNHGMTATLKYKNGSCEGIELPFRYDNVGRPFGDVIIDSKPVSDVLLDSGSVYCLLGQDAADSLDDYVRENAAETDGCSVNGCAPGKFESEVNKYCLGDICEEGIQIKYPVFNATGNSYFARFRVQFDFINDKLIFCDEDLF